MSLELGPPIDRVSGISLDEFLERYAFPGIPVVITDMAEYWPAYRRWTLDFFRETHGDLEVTLYRSGDASQHRSCKLADYLDRMGLEADRRPWYLAAWEFGRDCPELQADYTIPAYFRENWIESVPFELRQQDWRWLFIGPAGSHSNLHVDVAHSSAWNVVIAGAKAWRFFPADQQDLLYDGEADAFQPDLNRHPLLAQTRPLHAITRPGEILYTPSGWWHQAYNLEPGIAITENFCNETNFREVLAWFRDQDPLQYPEILAALFQARAMSQSAGS